MKILLVNNFHYVRGGSERAYFDTAEVLINKGHEVAFFSTVNEKNKPTTWSSFFVTTVEYGDKNLSLFAKLRAILNIWYNFSAQEKLEKLIKEFKPDVAHLHNVYHHLSPAIINTFKKHNVPIAMTLHDYKLICPNYRLLVRGEIWEKSKPRKYYQCFFDRCIKNSYLKSLVATLEAYLHKSLKVYEKIDLFISPSKFLADKFREFGFKKEIIHLPNPLLSLNHGVFEKEGAGKYILYYGRLSKEKGIDDLIEAYGKLNTDYKLKIVGSGPLKQELEERIVNKKLDKVEVLGFLEGDSLWREVRGAEFIVIPSKWYENAPYSVIEAMSLGKVVVCSRIGGLKDLIIDNENGFSYELKNKEELLTKMQYIVDNPEIKESIGQKARKFVEKNNSQTAYYEKLINIYNELIKNKN